MTPPVVWQLDGQLLDVLAELEVLFERVEAGAYVLTLVGARRPSTLVWLIAGEQAVSVEAFVMHVVDVADPAPLHRYLLARNLRLRDVHFGLDDVGSFVWRRLQRTTTLDALIAAVTDEYDVAADRAETDLRALIADLRAADLVAVGAAARG